MDSWFLFGSQRRPSNASRSRYVVKRMQWKRRCGLQASRKGTSFHFEYPEYLIVEGDEVSHKSGAKLDYHGNFKISSNVNEYNAVANVLLWNGIHRCEDRMDCNLFWSKPLKVFDNLKDMPYQRVNHFPGSSSLANKSQMALHISLKAREKGIDAFNIIPMTFILPAQIEVAQNAIAGSDCFWIWKPSNGSCGKGIQLISPKSQLPDTQAPSVLSLYIPNPFLIDGIKFDLRLYVVVTSFDPLRVYLFDDGLVRFSTEQYSLDEAGKNDLNRHLTNYSVNKTSANFSLPKVTDIVEYIESDSGSKWSVQGLKKYLQTQRGVDIKALEDAIEDIILKSIIAVEEPILNASMKTECPRYSCFELFGFDVLIDENLKPWLLEVNMLPSLSSSSPLDKGVKTTLMTDLLNLVNIPAVDTSIWENDMQLDQCASTSRERILDLKELELMDGITESYLEEHPDDRFILKEMLQEMSQSTHFSRLYPKEEPAEQETYSSLFTYRRYYNVLQDKFLRLPKASRDHITSIL